MGGDDSLFNENLSWGKKNTKVRVLHSYGIDSIESPIHNYRNVALLARARVALDLFSPIELGFLLHFD